MITKGKWKVKYEFNVENEHGRLVCTTGGYSNNMDVEGVHNENVSNAQAIAALPEMIEALQRAKHVFDVNTPRQQEVMEQIQDALKKAGV